MEMLGLMARLSICKLLSIRSRDKVATTKYSQNDLTTISTETVTLYESTNQGI